MFSTVYVIKHFFNALLFFNAVINTEIYELK